MTFSSLSNKINFLIVPKDKNKKGCVEGLQCTTTEHLWLLEPPVKLICQAGSVFSEGLWRSRHSGRDPSSST